MTRLVALVQGVVNIAIRRVRWLRGMRLIIRWRAMSIALSGDGVQRGLKVMSSSSSIACTGLSQLSV